MTNSAVYIALLVTGLSVTACQHQVNNQHQASKKVTTEKYDTLSVVTYQLQQGGWAYTVNVGKKVYIRQEFIPGIPGYNRFTSKEDARKVGVRMVEKMLKDPHLLPAITKQDLLEMGIDGVK